MPKRNIPKKRPRWIEHRAALSCGHGIVVKQDPETGNLQIFACHKAEDQVPAFCAAMNRQVALGLDIKSAVAAAAEEVRASAPAN